eukprot:g4702.t1
MCCRGSTSSRFLQKYYVINFLIIISYLFIRIFGQKDYIYGLTSAEGWTGLPRELEISVSVLIVCISRYRNAKTIDHYINTVIMFLKTLVIVFLYFIDGRIMVWYLIIYFIIFLVLKGVPVYNGPQKIQTFYSINDFENNVTGKKASNKNVIWLIAFVTDWNPDCHFFIPVFAELSLRYTNATLQFGQIDIGKFPELAEVFKIDVSGMSNQLPSFVLFEHGIEKKRLPPLNKKNEVIKTIITKESMIRVFELDTRYLNKQTKD